MASRRALAPSALRLAPAIRPSRPILSMAAPAATRPSTLGALGARCYSKDRPPRAMATGPRPGWSKEQMEIRLAVRAGLQPQPKEEPDEHEEEPDEHEEAPRPESRIWTFVEMKKLINERRADPSKINEDNIVIIDVREPKELMLLGKIPSAINIPITSAVQSFHLEPQDFEEMYGFKQPDKDAELVFYCKSGVRARGAAQLARHAGWKKTGEFPGSWDQWMERRGLSETVEDPREPYYSYRY
ncbi:hypothetical protein FZEAL_419 [Fusarium zealandicum]|uniref:Rhodanese domain-containing protein n=1 Tax=Fusarium zealandicum TaxID=1053134 RepID=A0A8H4UV91_9HYPO|nr:hypothetical protein FZEAL_419 [Fusarium zealandicum]